jgi:hypothetical protein
MRAPLVEINGCRERMDMRDQCHCHRILFLAHKSRAKDSYTNPFDGHTAFNRNTLTGRHRLFYLHLKPT